MCEHDVYVCSWKRSPEGITVWVKSRPEVCATAPDFSGAEERLLEAIQDAGGAIQAVMEFDPPPPRSALEAKYTNPEILRICGDDRFETDAPRWKFSETPEEIESRMRWLDAFYETPVCRNCRYTSGRRNTKPVTLTGVSSRYDGGFGAFGTDGGPSHVFVSEAFLALLTNEERSRLEFQPTIRQGRKKYYELVGPAGPPFVGVAGLKPSGWQCVACGFRLWGYWSTELPIHSFVARAELPDPLPGVFTIGSLPGPGLAVTASRWKELVGRKGTRGFTSQAVGVLSDSEVVRCPELPAYQAQPRKLSQLFRRE